MILVLYFPISFFIVYSYISEFFFIYVIRSKQNQFLIRIMVDKKDSSFVVSFIHFMSWHFKSDIILTSRFMILLIRINCHLKYEWNCGSINDISPFFKRKEFENFGCYWQLEYLSSSLKLIRFCKPSLFIELSIG